MISNKNNCYKIVFLGESSTGKTSISVRFSKNEYYEYSESTIGAAFLTGKILIDDEEHKFEIWDTAGQERYNSLAPMYYHGAKAAIVVFDITNRSSFNRAKRWITELYQSSSKNIVIVLTGNKCDLEKNREISKEEAQEYADENNIDYIETSAKENRNIKKLFKIVGNKIPKNIEKYGENINIYEEKSILVKKKNCC